MSRHSVDGRFTFADQRATQVVGYAPADLLGKLCYEFYHPEDQQHMRDNFDQGLLKFVNYLFYVLWLLWKINL